MTTVGPDDLDAGAYCLRALILCVELGASREGALFGEQGLGGLYVATGIDGRRHLGGAHGLICLVGAGREVLGVEALLLGDRLELLGDAVELVGIEAITAAAPNRVD